ncbi:MAG TPA: CsbD family protein [Terriglobales bacterium]|nr:CsbD family protein [Terriglobales bacterium]
MNSAKKDKVEGQAKDIKGRVQRQVGEWTGDTKQQVKGAGNQVAGKAQKLAGKLKEHDRNPQDPKKRDNLAA